MSQKPAFWNREEYEYSEGYGKFQESLGLSGHEEEMEIDYGICSAQEKFRLFPRVSSVAVRRTHLFRPEKGLIRLELQDFAPQSNLKLLNIGWNDTFVYFD